MDFTNKRRFRTIIGLADPRRGRADQQTIRLRLLEFVLSWLHPGATTGSRLELFYAD